MTVDRPDTPPTRPLALVTGASNGIGLEIARELARRGHDLVVTGRSPRTEEVAEELRGLGVDTYPVRADLADYDAVEALWKATIELGHPLDVAVLNAGIGVGGAFADVDLAEDLKLIDLNVKSVVHLAKRVMVDMIPRRRGRILMTSSISATQPTPYETTYGPSRAFVYMFAESLRAEVLEHGITVTALLPGRDRQRLPRPRRHGRHEVRRQQLEERQARWSPARASTPCSPARTPSSAETAPPDARPSSTASCPNGSRPSGTPAGPALRAESCIALDRQPRQRLCQRHHCMGDEERRR